MEYKVMSCQLKIGGDTMIVITSSSHVHGILNLRGATTSDRPPSYFMDLVTHGEHAAFLRYSEPRPQS